MTPPTSKTSPSSQTQPRSPQFAESTVEFYAQGHGRTGHSKVYLQHLRTAVADACEAKITAMELRRQIAAAELAGLDRRDLKALAHVVEGVEKSGVGFDKLREVREVTLLGGTVVFTEECELNGVER